MNNPIIPFYKQIDQYIVKAEGCHMFDANGKRYVDFESGDWAANIGHSNKAINAIIREQAEKLIHDGLRFRNRESEALAEKLSAITGLRNGKSVFVNSGSEAVNLALTLAKKLTGRQKILKMDCTYLSAFGHGQIAPENTNLISIPINETEKIASLDFAQIAGFAFEPGNSWGLIKIPDERFIAAIAEKIRAFDGLLIANEVTTGFGRTGKWFGFQHYPYNPDIISVGKALGNGYPVSGVCVAETIAGKFEHSPFRYAQSHQNDPLGCAIGLGVIDFMETNHLIEKAEDRGRYFKHLLIGLHQKNGHFIKDIRGNGLMIAMELDTAEHAITMYERLIDKGFLAGQKENVLRFMPPLIITEPDIDELILSINNILSSLA